MTIFNLIRVCLFLSVSLIIYSCRDSGSSVVVHEEKFDSSRLLKVKLASDLDEPMEIAITSEGKVIIIERKGAVKMFLPEANSVKQIATMKVHSGHEDGLLGLALDPQYSKNNFVYFFYSPEGSKPIQRVSRFTLQKDSLDLSSEKILLEIPTQRQECCHSAGSLAFGPDGNLFIAIGDNTNPHNPGYYNSIDERKGREYWDAQRTASNTNDYRGKILRIHPEPDGTYTIPEGNLFPKGTPDTKPEIYVMGCRNPYRISVDPVSGWLYWGDVGQNTIDDPKRGPISYDEWHLARDAGFYGWPYFAGPNAAYADFDYATGKIGPFFDSSKPENSSVNNTGLKILPPAKRALIWYSYDSSKLFAHLGTGGKSPIAGPAFYTELYKERINDSTKHLHAYFNNKVFIAEWLRDWINVITVDKDGKLDSIETFMPGTTFSHPIDLEISPEGILYVLEYGTHWFEKNKDAGLYKIEYHRGEITPQMRANAAKGNNAEPEISFDVKNGNRSFYWENVPIEYTVGVFDKEDGSLQDRTIPADDVKVSLAYSVMGTDLTTVSANTGTVTAAEPDLALIRNSDCKACHAMNEKSVGPSYISIAERYKKDTATVNKLANKIIKGGSGAWGEFAMSAHPSLSQEHATEMVNYILSLKDGRAESRAIPASGKIMPGKQAGDKKFGAYVVTVTYNDKPAKGTGSNLARRNFIIRSSRAKAVSADSTGLVEKTDDSKIKFSQNGSWVKFSAVHLANIASVTFELDGKQTEGALSVRMDRRDGKEIGKVNVSRKTGSVTTPLAPNTSTADLYIVFQGKAPAENNVLLDWVIFNRGK